MENVMRNPVTHFEVLGRYPESLREFCASAFGWTMHAPAGGYAMATPPPGRFDPEHIEETISAMAQAQHPAPADAGATAAWREIAEADRKLARHRAARSARMTSAPDSPPPHPAQRPGSCVITSSGHSLICGVTPGWHFGRPGFRPDLPRSGWGACFARPSPGGGFDEFRGFWPSRAPRSATSAVSTATCARGASSCAW
jgi:predicted enzyme related to lactoylglutathione lyase